MKKILFFAVAFVAIRFADFCSTSSTHSQNGSDSTMVDTLNVDSNSVVDSANVDSTTLLK